MTGAIPPSVPPDAARLLERAYGLRTPEDSHELYRDWAPTYDRTMLDGLGYLSPARLADLVAAHLPDRRSLILDAGCGTGLAALELARRGYSRFHGLDASTDMLTVAEARGLYDSLARADLTRPLNFATGLYDGVVSTGTFTHGHVGADCLEELVRVLRPGGILACTVHRDIWASLGFAAKIDTLLAGGGLKEIERFLDTYYATASEPDGYYCVFEKA